MNDIRRHTDRGYRSIKGSGNFQFNGGGGFGSFEILRYLRNLGLGGWDNPLGQRGCTYIIFPLVLDLNKHCKSIYHMWVMNGERPGFLVLFYGLVKALLLGKIIINELMKMLKT